MKGVAGRRLVLAVYPNTRGIAFTLFEGPLVPVDWGVMEVRAKDKNNGCLRRVSLLIERYGPDVLVLQDMRAPDTRRARRVIDLNRRIGSLARRYRMWRVAVSRAQVRECFCEVHKPTKQSIAEAIAKRIPAFKRFVPPPRKIWKSEDPRMGLFDAAALALTFFHMETNRRRKAA